MLLSWCPPFFACLIVPVDMVWQDPADYSLSVNSGFLFSRRLLLHGSILGLGNALLKYLHPLELFITGY